MRGDLAEGFAEYEWRHQMKSVPPLLSPRPLQPLWDGQKVAPGGLLLVADQGFGDVIQFCRYMPMVAERSPGFVVACNPEVVPILRQQAGVGEIIIAPQGLPVFASWSPLSTLPLIFGTTLATIPMPIPYIRAEPERTRRWGERIAAAVPAGYLRVGIVWAGRPTHGNDRNRSTTLKAFAPIAALDRVVLLSLQMGAPQTQLDGYAGRAPLVDLGREIVDFGDSAAILENLDLVDRGRYLDRPSGGCHGPAGLGAAGLRARLALDARPGGQPVVSQRGAAAPAGAGPLGRRHGDRAAKRLQAMTPGA